MSDPALFSLAGALRALRERQFSSQDLVSACLKRIERWQPRLNAFVEIEPHPKNAAGPRAGTSLSGIPLAHKDMFYRAGKVSNCGSNIRRGWIAPSTSAALERLDAAGALQLGTLNMAEFAYGPTGHNEHWGDCRNPWDVTRITGGSSSGSGAAVAARLVFGALGSDTGGSVRLPAALCGITGLKTTLGRVSRHGAMPLSHSLDTIGPLARSAEDCALLLREIAGFDPRDPTTSREPVLAELSQPARGLRIGIATGWVEKQAHPEIAGAVREAARTMAALGMAVTEVEPPDLEALVAHGMIVMQAEASAQHARWMRERPGDYGSAVRARLEPGYAIPATVYLDSLRLRTPLLEKFCATTLGEADAFLLPVLNIPAPTLEQTGARGGAEMRKVIGELTPLARWVNYLGVPALALPGGFDTHGMPIGLQLVGRPFAEQTLLRIGHAYQQGTDWHLRAPHES
jgi:aspartyl-tRNA(Asn)/glutamyl-tRNA(Gln) amidotransferase subunit A